MNEIPEDVMWVARGCCTDGDIARAILAERKRCADIARMMAKTEVGGGCGIANGLDHQQGCKDAGDWILTEILEPCK